MLRHVTPIEFSASSVVGNTQQTSSGLNTDNSQKMYTVYIKSRNACCHLVQKILSSGLLPDNLNFKIYRKIILPVVLCGCETWSLTLREERRLMVFENRVLRRIFGPKRAR